MINPLDHRSAVEPWRLLQRRLAGLGREVDLIDYGSDASGEADLADLLSKITTRTRLIIISHVHHLFGGRSAITELRRRIDPAIRLLADCTQSAGHLPLEFSGLGADFAVVSAHKMLGVPGTGILYCRRRVHAELIEFCPAAGRPRKCPVCSRRHARPAEPASAEQRDRLPQRPRPGRRGRSSGTTHPGTG